MCACNSFCASVCVTLRFSMISDSGLTRVGTFVMQGWGGGGVTGTSITSLLVSETRVGF